MTLCRMSSFAGGDASEGLLSPPFIPCWHPRQQAVLENNVSNNQIIEQSRSNKPDYVGRKII